MQLLRFLGGVTFTFVVPFLIVITALLATAYYVPWQAMVWYWVMCLVSVLGFIGIVVAVVALVLGSCWLGHRIGGMKNSDDILDLDDKFPE